MKTKPKTIFNLISSPSLYIVYSIFIFVYGNCSWFFKHFSLLFLNKMSWTWDFQQCGMCDKQSLRSACAYAQSDQSLCLSLEYSMSVKLLTEHHLEFQSLKGGCTGSSESTHVKIPNCWKSCVTAQNAGFRAWNSHKIFLSEEQTEKTSLDAV